MKGEGHLRIQRLNPSRILPGQACSSDNWYLFQAWIGSQQTDALEDFLQVSNAVKWAGRFED